MTAEQFYEACKWLIEQRSRAHAVMVFQALLQHVDDEGKGFADAINGLIRIGWEAVKKNAEDKIAERDTKAVPEPSKPK